MKVFWPIFSSLFIPTEVHGFSERIGLSWSEQSRQRTTKEQWRLLLIRVDRGWGVVRLVSTSPSVCCSLLTADLLLFPTCWRHSVGKPHSVPATPLQGEKNQVVAETRREQLSGSSSPRTHSISDLGGQQMPAGCAAVRTTAVSSQEKSISPHWPFHLL